MVSDLGVPVPWQGRSEHSTVGSSRPQAEIGAALLQVLLAPAENPGSEE